MLTFLLTRSRDIVRAATALGAFVAVPALAASSCFLHLDGIQGGSANAAHVGWSDCETVKFGATIATVSGGVGGGGAGKPNWKSIAVTKRADRADEPMFDVLLTGKHVATASVVLEEPGANGQRVLQTLNLKGVRITSLAEVSEAGVSLPELSLTLEFDQVQFVTPVYNNAGTVVSTESLTYTVGTNIVTQP